MPEPAFLNKYYYVYIFASGRNGTLYIGTTNDLKRRIGEHKLKLKKGFTEKYTVNLLVWYESTNSALAAISRKKQIKGGSRAKKIALIEKMNPKWEDIYDSL